MFSHAPVQLDPASEATYLSLVGQVLKVYGLDSAISAKQDALPTVTNGYYLHANADTGELEWAAGGGGSGTDFYDGSAHAVTGSSGYITYLSGFGESPCIREYVQPASGGFFFECVPGSATAFGALCFSTAGGTDDVITFQPGRSPQLRLDIANGTTFFASNIKTPNILTYDPGDGVSLWCDPTDGLNTIRLSILAT